MFNLNSSAIKYLKVFSVMLSMIWLFLKSPINPLYNDYNSSEMFSVYFSFIYWLFVVAFIFWLAFYINTNNHEKHLSKILFISISLWYLFFIPYGYETTDTGYHLSKQWSMFHGLWIENFNVFAGTNFFGGLWLLIAGQPSLLWARIGFVIVQATIVIFTFKILNNLNFYRPVFVAIITFLVAVSLSYFQYYHTINYDNLSYMFILLSMHFLIKDIYSDADKKHNYIFSGIFTFLAIFSKLTYLTSLMMPLIIIIMFKKDDRKKLFKLFLVFYKTIIILSILFVVFVVAQQELFNWYVDYIRELLNEFLTPKSIAIKEELLRDHSFLSLYGRYFLSIISVLINAMISIPFIILTAFLLKKYENSKIISWSLLVLFGILFFNRIFIKGYLQIGLIAFYISVFMPFYLVCRKQIAKRISILVLAVLIFTFSFLGSDLVLNTAFKSGSGLLLISLIVLIISEKKCSKYFRFDQIIYMHIALSFFFFIFIGTTEYRPYRDYMIGELNYNFKFKCLNGIKSNIARVEIVDSLMTYLNTIENLNKIKVFYAKGNALFYYLTGCNYILSSPWDMIIPFDKIKRELQANPPDLFVMSAHTHSDALWPVKDPGYITHPYSVRAIKYYAFYDEFIKENKYIEVYKNSFYTVYSLDNRVNGDERTGE